MLRPLVRYGGHGLHSPAARVDMTLIDGRVFFDRKTSPSLEAMRLRISALSGASISKEAVPVSTCGA